MIHVVKHSLDGDLSSFLNVVDTVYEHTPHYVRSLDMDLKDRLNPRKNPFFLHGKAVAFTAFKDGKAVGRISASIDSTHLQKYGDNTGFFGFLDTINDQNVASALLSHAENWLKSQGISRILGPFSLNINEETGCLIEGFDSPPYVMMTHHNDYQASLIEGAGYTKAKDFYAWKYTVGDLNTRTQKAWNDIKDMPEVSFRPLSMKTLESDVAMCVDIFNDAWSENWGSLPLSREEATKMASDFKLILFPEITRLVMIDGEPAAFAIALPNLNELTSDLNGKLLPFGAFKLLYRLKIVGAKTGRLALLGIRKKFQKNRKYAGLSHFLYAEMNEGGRRLGMREGELSWTLEDNAAINVAVRLLGAKIYKKYRVFEKQI